MSVRLHGCTAGTRPRSALQWRLRRGHESARRLAFEVSTLAVVHGAVCLGPDEAVRRSFDRVGLGQEAVAVVGFRVSGYPCTIAVPTFRTWNRHDMQHRIMSAVRDATSTCRSTMLASPFDVTAQPRLGNVERMLRTMRPPAIGDGVSLVRLLEAQNGEASLAQCMSVIANPFALERIFGLMAGGLVEIELLVPIGDESRVRLRSSEWPFDWLDVRARGHTGKTRSLLAMSTQAGRASNGQGECGIAEAAGLRAGLNPFEREADHGT